MRQLSYVAVAPPRELVSTPLSGVVIAGDDQTSWNFHNGL